MPKASIIITTHNRPHLLPRAVESALRAGSDVEVVVVDDASVDDTANVCRKLDDKIKYVRVDRNQGVAGARNIGVLASKGEFISFLDDDDTRLPGSLDKQIERLREEPQAGLIYAQTIVGDQNGNPGRGFTPLEFPQGDLFNTLLTRNFIPCGSVVFRRSALLAVGLLDDSISGPDDWDCWIRIAELYPVIALEEPVGIWRQSTPASGQGSSHSARLISSGIKKFDQWMKLPRIANASRRTKRGLWLEFSARMAARLIWESVRALKYRRLKQIGENLATISHLHPLAVPRVMKTRVWDLGWTGLRELWKRAA